MTLTFPYTKYTKGQQSVFCQAQSNSSFSSAEQTELGLFSANPATHLHPPGKVYLEAVAN